MTVSLDAIVALQSTLSELHAADQRLHSIPDWMHEVHEEHSRRQAEIDEVAAARDEADRQRREAEAEIADAQQKLAHYQEQLALVSTQREYGALLKEIDTVKDQIRNAEQTTLDALEEGDRLKQEQEELEEAFRGLDEQYQQELAKWEKEKPGVESTIEKLTSQKEALRSGVPKNVLLLFDRIYERYEGEALARVRKISGARGNVLWHCEACSYNVRPQTVVEIRNGNALNQCDSCKRILFWEEEEDD